MRILAYIGIFVCILQLTAVSQSEDSIIIRINGGFLPTNDLSVSLAQDCNVVRAILAANGLDEFRNNQIAYIPEEIGNLDTLYSLTLGNNIA